ncbi:MAG: HAD family hydrolase [Treponemataceae bacterium]|nr:HAD family hydrolase [Treponemataceae bacterium]
MNSSIEAVAFDIDGTLYANWRLYVRIMPYFLRHLPFFIQYNKVRKVLHRTAPLPDFYEYQARLLSENMHISVEDARAKIDRIIYKGLVKFFIELKPYPHIKETFESFQKAGLKLAILSDFPPEQKGDIWGLAPLCSAVLGSEACGALKPSKYAFGLLARELNVAPEKILYVGNNLYADIYGAKQAGMKTAYILPFWKSIFGIKGGKHADISFKNYRQLKNLVLE